VLALAAAIRLVHLGAASLWLDEIFQSYLVHAPAKTFWASLRFDAVHPPGDYLVGRAVEVFHPSDTAKKIPGVLWGVGSIAALAALMRRRGGARVGFLTAALLAVAPFHVRYSQEYRPYALGTFSPVCRSGSSTGLWNGRRSGAAPRPFSRCSPPPTRCTSPSSPSRSAPRHWREPTRGLPMRAAGPTPVRLFVSPRWPRRSLLSSTPPGGASSEGPRVA
jgi:hypothetical protein